MKKDVLEMFNSEPNDEDSIEIRIVMEVCIECGTNITMDDSRWVFTDYYICPCCGLQSRFGE